MEKKESKKRGGKKVAAETKVEEAPKTEMSETPSENLETKTEQVTEAEPTEKVEEQTASEAPATETTEESAAETAPAVQEEKPSLPAMPEGFCMTPEEWASTNKCYDPNITDCTKLCAEESPETFAACKARAEFLAIQSKSGAGKTTRTRTPGAKKEKAPPKPNQTNTINRLLVEQKPLAEIISTLARDFYSGDEKVAGARVKRHISSVEDGSCNCATAMQPYIKYLKVVPETKADAPEAAAPEAAAASVPAPTETAPAV